jgi:site-specific DNA recombinase
MRAAIYARYSSENQRPESIDDQVRACMTLAAARGFTVSPAHIFSDEAKSGALRDRPGLEALSAAARGREFEAVLVDDLSRLSRDNHFLLTLYAELRFHGVRIVSRADSLDSDDRHSKLGFQMRGIVNELYLDDLREKTLRGQLGQKARGFNVGEATFGYRSQPVGDMRVDRRGRPRPDGYRMVIDAAEAAVVRRIFDDFASGKSIKLIVRQLNGEGVPGRRRLRGGWSAATVSRILKNEKYVGRWTWNRTETRRDPITGRKRRFPKPEAEWHLAEDESLRIIAADVWERGAARWREVDRVWPIRKVDRDRRGEQRSYVDSNPTHLLSGILTCGRCGHSMGQVSGKGSGYYGCLAATRGACDNKLLVARRLAERRVIRALEERLRDTDAILRILERVKDELARLNSHLPTEIRLKRAALEAEERRVANFVDFIGRGNGTKALSQALEQAEAACDSIQREVAALEATMTAAFEPPPAEWIARRVGCLQEVLERKTGPSALVMRRILGPVRLVPTKPDVGRPYYQAETAIQVLELLEDPDGGSNWSQQWRRGESNPRPKAHPRTRLRAWSAFCRHRARAHRRALTRPAGGLISTPTPPARRGSSPN